MTKKFLSSIYACIFITCVFSCKNESVEKTTIYDQFVQDYNEAGFTTGNLLIYEEGKIIHKSSNGLQNIDPETPLNLNSTFRLASVSKQFTGMAIMKLKEAGKLDYDQNVNTIIPEFPYDNITVRHLLHHTSGLSDYMQLMSNALENMEVKEDVLLGNDEIMTEFFKVKPALDFQPGERWDYSNTGYMILASIVEKISGVHFSQFLKEQVFDPLGMNNTSVYKYQIAPDENMPNRVFGYTKSLNQRSYSLNDYNFMNDVRGDGGVYSTLDDLFKWNQALVNYEIIGEEYLKEAWTPGKLNNGESTDYGFGWFLDSEEGEPLVVSHSGGWVGFGTFLRNEVETNSGFVLLTNNSFEYFGDILNALQNIYKGDPYQLPRKPIENVLAEKILNDDIDSSMDFFNTIKTDTINYNVSEEGINILGYRLMNEEHLEEATAIFELNISEYPNSANTYDSYGDLLLVKGDSIKALENFKKCFAMDSTLKYAQDKADKLEAALN
ncbi:MAG: serine hydrolase [bacterium]